MAKSRRIEKVASLIRRELSELLTTTVHNEKVRQGMVTITEVEVSGDLQHCKIFVSVFGEEQQKEDVMEGLNSVTSFLRGELGRRLQMRRAPEIIFKLDKGIQKGASVLTLLEKLEEERKADSIKISNNQT